MNKQAILMLAMLLLATPMISGAVQVTRHPPPGALTGVTVAAINGYNKVYSEEGGVLVDRTMEFMNPSSNVQIMAADNDYVYFGTNDFELLDLHWNLSIKSSTNLALTFEASTGDNAWQTITVTDTTTGLTTNGSVKLARSTTGLTQLNLMAKATKDGAGNTIGDGVSRFYWRIKRTTDAVGTPPTEGEAGTGILTPGATYYYTAANVSAYTYYPLRSTQCLEQAVTTTFTKRTVNMSWNTNSNYEIVTRTPTPYAYTGTFGQITAELGTSYGIDAIAQTVKTQAAYYAATSGTSTKDYVIDNGLIAVAAAYSASYGFYTNYAQMGAFNWSIGKIIVSGGNATNTADFGDILAADNTGGWDTFHRADIGHNGGIPYYTCHDLLYINDYFYDSRFDLRVPIIDTYNSTDVQLGDNLDTTTTGFWYNGGTITITYIPHGASGLTMRLRYTRLYNFKILEDATTFGTINIYHSTLKDVYIKAYQELEFIGSGTVMDGVRLYGQRYGLTVDEDAAADGYLNDIKIMNGRSINGPVLAAGQEITFRNFWLVGTASSGPSQPLNYVGGVFYMINPKGVIDWTRSTNGIPATFVQYVGYEGEIKVVDYAGQPVSGAIVRIQQVNESDIAGSPFTTYANGSTGKIDILTEKYIMGISHMELSEAYNPHTITINNDQTFQTNITQKIDWEIPVGENKMMDMILLLPLIIAGLFFYISTKLTGEDYWALSLGILTFGFVMILIALGLSFQLLGLIYPSYTGVQDALIAPFIGVGSLILLVIIVISVKFIKLAHKYMTTKSDSKTGNYDE
jgi:hypothetical protein